MMKTTLVIQGCLLRLKSGDVQARDELIARFMARLRELTRRMMLARKCVVDGNEFEELIGEATARIRTGLLDASPDGVETFFQLGTAHLRYELTKLADEYFHPQDTDVNQTDDDSDASTQSELSRLANPTNRDEGDTWSQWQQFHDAAERLPEIEKKTFDLMWYHGLTQAEAAEVLGMSDKEMKRYWNSARLILKSNMTEYVRSE